MTIRREDLVWKVAKDLGIKQDLAKALVDAVFKSLADFLKEGKDIQIRGFGTWRVKESRRKMGYNFWTKQKIEISPKKRIHFKAHFRPDGDRKSAK